jgi:hypothetical protein
MRLQTPLTSAFAAKQACAEARLGLAHWTTSERVGRGSADACVRDAMRKSPRLCGSVPVIVQRIPG